VKSWSCGRRLCVDVATFTMDQKRRRSRCAQGRKLWKCWTGVADVRDQRVQLACPVSTCLVEQYPSIQPTYKNDLVSHNYDVGCQRSPAKWKSLWITTRAPHLCRHCHLLNPAMTMTMAVLRRIALRVCCIHMVPLDVRPAEWD
jgi:hypothetical protein